MTDAEYDFVVIGGGSAGYNGAATAAALGLRVAVIEGGEEVGGLCILRGCMPSKALIESANRFITLRRAEEFGLKAENIAAFPSEILERKNRLIAEFADYRTKQLEAGRFDFIRGFAVFVDPHAVEVSTQAGENLRITGKTFLVATGSSLKDVDVPGLCDVGCIDSDGVLEHATIPKSLIVLGAGAIGLEFAHYFAGLGSEVTIIQRSSQILKEADPDVAAHLADGLEKRGVRILARTNLKRVEAANGLKRVIFNRDNEEMNVDAEEILYALGRVPELKHLQVEQAGLECCRQLQTSLTQQTAVPHIFAAGDVSGPFEIVHIAIQQAEMAARNAARLIREPGCKLEEIDYRLKLFAVFTSPEVAFVGLTEKELQAAGVEYRVAQYPFADHGKSLVLGEPEGMVKLIASASTREIVGAAVVGPKASELIHEMVVAMYFHATAADLMKVPHYHPTLSEIWTYPAEELAQV